MMSDPIDLGDDDGLAVIRCEGHEVTLDIHLVAEKVAVFYQGNQHLPGDEFGLKLVELVQSFGVPVRSLKKAEDFVKAVQDRYLALKKNGVPAPASPASTASPPAAPALPSTAA